MLCHLAVENIALIERQNLEPPPALSIITGETGAGKSILIDALTLVLGERADGSLLRAGSEQAMVTARFSPPATHPVWMWLREHALERGEEEIFLRRVLQAGGRSRAFINETAVPLATLKQLGDQLVDLHGQHDHQSLMNASAHLTILDAFAQHPELVEKSTAAFLRWQEIKEKLQEAKQQRQTSDERRSFLSFHLQELEAAAIRPGEMEELEARRARLVHAARLVRSTEAALEWLDELPQAATTLLGRAAGELEGAAPLDNSLTPLAETIRSLQYELDDAVQRLQHYRSGLESDPEHLEALEERVHRIRQLARKHRCPPEALAELEEKWRMELESLENIEETEEALTRQLTTALQAYRQEATQLGESRRRAASRLTREVEQHLGELHMAHTRFAVPVEPLTGDPRRQGMEEVAFQVSANPGEPLKPLRQIASGGEISRLMLALKNVLADAVPVPTLIFDEVDVGVGGRVATAIGNKLARLAATGRQVIAITHQPQVAAWGDAHYKVEKESRNGRTHVTVTLLDESGRENELARMLAGDEITPQARQNGHALLQAAERGKTSFDRSRG